MKFYILKKKWILNKLFLPLQSKQIKEIIMTLKRINIDNFYYDTINENYKVGDWCIVNQINNISGDPIYELGKITKIGSLGIHYFDDLSICFGKHELINMVHKIVKTNNNNLK